MAQFVIEDDEFTETSVARDPDVVRELARLKELIEGKLRNGTLQAMRLNEEGNWDFAVKLKR